MIIDIIGYIGTILILYSFTIESMFKLRVVNSIGCVVWIVYGIGIGANPTILVNACVLCIHTYWFIKHRRKKKKRSIDKDEYGWHPHEGV
jgi:hypothetical protein